MSACAVDDFGIAPNWLGSMMFSMAGPTYILTTKSSATLDNDGVKDMGLMCFDTFVIGFCLGKGVTSANFQGEGSCCLAKEQFKMLVTGSARISAYSFMSQLPIPSGPDAFRGFSAERALCTEETGRVGTSESLS